MRLAIGITNSHGRDVGCRRIWISPVVGDCVVELVGLEPTTKVLWNMVGVRPAPLVGHLSRSPGVLTVLLDFPGFLILEPTTKVLWNMAGVRPTTLIGHPSRSSGICCFRDYPGSWSDSNEQPDFKESGSSPTSPPRRTLFISVRLCGNDILLGLPLPLFRGGLIM